MRLTHAYAMLCLLAISACSVSQTTCPKRVPFAGKTVDDLISYTGTLERQYDACSGVTVK